MFNNDDVIFQNMKYEHIMKPTNTFKNLRKVRQYSCFWRRQKVMCTNQRTLIILYYLISEIIFLLRKYLVLEIATSKSHMEL